jgi:ribonucleoside-diphosphate reductase alpha chain
VGFLIKLKKVNLANLYPIQDRELSEILEPQPGNGKACKDGLIWNRLLGDGDPHSAINWETRTAKITKSDGTVVFEQEGVEVPDFWSQTATDIVASKYFRGQLGTPAREYSAQQMVDRVAVTIAEWGLKDGYFKTQEDCENFKQDLKFLLINQWAAFNSPVWFNVGVYERPQTSACFILSVEDNMQSILEWYRDEGWIFKYGSGSGINLSKLRSSREPLSRGGRSSGPVSFMKGADGVANSIRSGGTTRRAAKMVILNADHPDIKDFIFSKKTVEDMTRILEASGIKASIEGELFNPYTLLPYQNANNSVRVTDEFMQKVETDGDWELKAITTGETLETIKARQMMDWIVDAAWHSADPGLQFDTTINDWHTCPVSGRINASNPCSEYMHLDNSACNLASLNLIKFLRPGGFFDIDSFKKAVDTIIIAQEIIVGNSSYPTGKITQNALDFRALGLGYANLGGLLMNLGLAYDSDEGRAVAAAITSIMCGEAYLMSSKIAEIFGPFNGFAQNREPMLRIINKHASAARGLADTVIYAADSQITGRNELIERAVEVWDEALVSGEKYGFRNAQTTVLAPTGTIAFLMDCDTTGIEPELALIKYKKLVGGGTLKLVNSQVPAALERLGYDEQQISDISSYLLERETIEGAPHLNPGHLPIFDCSFKAQNGTRSIHYMGHIKMMGAVQPFISGAISKTVNLPNDATLEDIRNAFMQAWKLGLKAVAVYRDGCKSVQPLNTADTAKDEELKKKEEQGLVEKINGYTRIKLPNERPSITHKFSLANHEGYLTIGLYPDTNQPGETFITIAKEGSTISGLFDVIATLTSMCLQSGVPLKTLVKKFKDLRFEPAGFTSNPEIPFAKSFIDYIFKYLGHKFLSEKDKEEIFGPEHAQLKLTFGQNEEKKEEKLELPVTPATAVSAAALWEQDQKESHTDAPLCADCGTIMFKTGSCYSCPNCFATTGVCN